MSTTTVAESRALHESGLKLTQSGLVTVSGSSIQTLADYDNLSKQMASVTPSLVAYSSVNTGTPTTCPSVGGTTWLATATPLPPTPNAALCSCLPGTLACIASPSDSNTTYGTTFSYICGLNNGDYCDGILANGTTGQYGTFGMCAAEVQLDYVLNQYYQNYKNNDNVPSPCAFSGAATLQSTTSASGTCASLLGAAVTSSGGTGTSSGSTAAATSKSAAVAVGLRSVQNGYLLMSIYALVSSMTGAAAILL